MQRTAGRSVYNGDKEVHGFGNNFAFCEKIMMSAQLGVQEAERVTEKEYRNTYCFKDIEWNKFYASEKTALVSKIWTFNNEEFI